MAQRVFEHRRLLGNLFGHEVLIAAFVDACGIDGDCAHLAIGQSAIFVINFNG